MNEFKKEIEFLLRVEDPKKKRMNNRTKLSKSEIAKLRKTHPGIPEDFLSYLNEIGAGSFRECQFTVYGFLGSVDSIIGEGVWELEEPNLEVLCFGDDFSGYFSGFIPKRRWALVEVGSGGIIHRVKKPFRKYIREQMLMGPRGLDLRE